MGEQFLNERKLALAPDQFRRVEVEGCKDEGQRG
jgi:hypothetical protein